jgi:hypothetical protein
MCGSCTLSIDSFSGLESVSVDDGDLRVSTSATPGTATINYTLTTASGALTDSAVVTITVSNASPDAATTSAETAVTIDVIANDALNSTTVSAVSGPGAGIGTVDFVDRSVTFTPATNFSGLAQFTYTTDAGTSATVSVLVAPAMISVTTSAGTTVGAIALMPASCPDCEVTVVAGSDAGDLEIAGDGTFTFTPAENFVGTDDALRYEIHHLPTGLQVTGTVEVTVDAPVAALTAGLDLTVSIAAGSTAVGTEATVTYTVTNSGTATLSAVTLVDPLVASPFTCAPPGYPISELAPEAVATCTATFTITQAHINAGGVTSSATVSATSAVSGVDDPASVSASSTLSISRTAALDFAKSAALDTAVTGPADRPDVGDRINFSFTVTNSGTTTLTGVQIADPMPGLSALSCAPALPSAVEPGAVVECTAAVTITQAHLEAGGVTNSATVSASAPAGVTDPEVVTSVFVELAVTPSVTISATSPANPTVSATGDTVPITYTVTNNGPVALSNLSLAASGGTIDCLDNGNASIGSLGLNQSATCIVIYTITQDDFNLEEFAHSATVSGVTATGTQTTPVRRSRWSSLSSQINQARPIRRWTIRRHRRRRHQQQPTHSRASILTGYRPQWAQLSPYDLLPMTRGRTCGSHPSADRMSALLNWSAIPSPLPRLCSMWGRSP